MNKSSKEQTKIEIPEMNNQPKRESIVMIIEVLLKTLASILVLKKALKTTEKNKLKSYNGILDVPVHVIIKEWLVKRL